MVEITSVKAQVGSDLTTVTGYLVNGEWNVPASEGNRHYREIQAWINAGGSVTPAYTEAEINDIRAKQTKDDERETEAAQVKADATVKALINASPRQIENYVAKNVADLGTRDVLTRLVKAVSAIGRSQFR